MSTECKVCAAIPEDVRSALTNLVIEKAILSRKINRDLRCEGQIEFCKRCLSIAEDHIYINRLGTIELHCKKIVMETANIKQNARFIKYDDVTAWLFTIYKMNGGVVK